MAWVSPPDGLISALSTSHLYTREWPSLDVPALGHHIILLYGDKLTPVPMAVEY
jgi:hypothetical protein